jgi:hypothetical protein
VAKEQQRRLMAEVLLPKLLFNNNLEVYHQEKLSDDIPLFDNSDFRTNLSSNLLPPTDQVFNGVVYIIPGDSYDFQTYHS